VRSKRHGEVRASHARVVVDAVAERDRGDGFRVNIVDAAPRDDLVRPDERERCLVEIPHVPRRDVDDLELDSQPAGGVDQAGATGPRRTEPQQRPLEAELAVAAP
jgi:hypothetical protein